MSGIFDTSTWATYSITHDHERGSHFWVLYAEHVETDVRKHPTAHGWAPTRKEAVAAAKAATPAGRLPYENLLIARRLLSWKKFQHPGRAEHDRAWNEQWYGSKPRPAADPGGARSFEDRWSAFLRNREAPVASAALAALGLTEGATAEQIGRAYRQRAFDAHPDRGGDEKAFIELTRARDAALRLVAGK